MEPIFTSISGEVLTRFIENYVVEKADGQVANQVFREQSSTDPHGLENLKAVLLRADEVEMSEKDAKQLKRIRTICGNNIAENVAEVEYSSIKRKMSKRSLSRFEDALARAKEGDPLPACCRLALFICLRQNSESFSDEADMATKSDPFAAALMSLRNKNTMKPTREEIAPLYDEFLNAFDRILVERKQRQQKRGGNDKSYTLETLNIDWYVDYVPDGELENIISAWASQIEEARAKAGMPELPMGWGLGIKCSYRIQDGCAMFENNVIGHDGMTLKEDPWETFYRTEDPADEQLAMELRPNIPANINIKFENRKIVRTMGYTFTQDAKGLSYANNWGIVQHLIEAENGKISLKVGFKVLGKAVSAKQWRICESLFKAGLPIYEQKRVYSSDPFFIMIQKCDTWHLKRILKAIKLPKHNPLDFKNVSWALYIRYRYKYMDRLESKIFYELQELWIKAHYPNYESIYDVPKEALKQSTIDFKKSIVTHLDERGRKFKDSKFEESLRKAVKELN